MALSRSLFVAWRACIMIIVMTIVIVIVTIIGLWGARENVCAPRLHHTLDCMSSKQRDPDPNKNSSVRRNKAANVEWNPLHVDVSFLTEDSSLGLGSLGLHPVLVRHVLPELHLRMGLARVFLFIVLLFHGLICLMSILQFAFVVHVVILFVVFAVMALSYVGEASARRTMLSTCLAVMGAPPFLKAYMYIYIYREREREIYICIYI